MPHAILRVAATGMRTNGTLQVFITALLHEINHTDTQDFRAILKQQLDILEELKSKIHRLGESRD